MVTPVAPDGPLFVAVRLYVSVPPTNTGSGESDLVRARSVEGLTVVCALALLLALEGSNGPAVTLAEFVIVPALCGVTAIETVADAALPTVPRLQVTVPLACEQLPWEGVADWYVTPEGSVSVTVTPVALDGPRFWAVKL